MAKLAINGGEKCVSNPVKIKWPIVDDRDVEQVGEVVRAGRGGWCRLGLDDGEVATFEKEWADFQDAKYCLAVNNGTVAIECALQGLGLRPGEEVIVPAITFVASASGVLMARGIPVFADCIPETCQIDPEDVERKITERTRGVVVVHYGGYPVDMSRIKDVAERHGLFVLEDSAHAQGTQWEGRGVGAIGDVGTFSFQGSKSLTCGEGGAIVTDRQDVVEQRMSTAATLSEGLEDIPGIEPLKPDPRITRRGYYFYVLRLDEETWGVKKARFIEAFNAEAGFRVFSGYACTVYELPVFAKNRYDATGYPVLEGEGFGRVVDYKDVHCPNSELIAHHQHLTFSNQSLLYPEFAEQTLAILHKLWGNRAELGE